MSRTSLSDQLAALDLPVGRACRCGSRMDPSDVSEVGEWKVALWDCRRCGRRFGAQVHPETLEIVNTEWQRAA